MKDTKKTKEQLLKEIDQLKSKVIELENQNMQGLSHDCTKKYQAIYEGAYDGIIYVDDKTNILDVNQAFTEITGLKKEDVVGKTGFELMKTHIDPKQLAEFSKTIKSILSKKTLIPYELNLNNKVLEISTRKQENGHTVAIIRDITLRIHTEKLLLESEQRLKFLVENARDMIYRMSLPDGKYEFVSPASSNIYGYSPEEFYKSPLLIKKALHPDWRQYFDEEWAKLIEGEMSPIYEYQIIDKSGKTKWLHQRNVLIKDGNGQPIAIESVVSDFTEDKLNREKLLQREAKYRSLFENSADATLIIAGDKFINCNQATLNMLGYSSKDELFEMHPSQLSPELQADGRNSAVKADEMMEIAYKKGNHRFEWIHQRKNGELFPVEVLLTNVFFGEKKSLHVVWRDITYRKIAEEALKRSEYQYRNYFEKDISGIFLSTPEGKLLDFNPAFTRLLGYSDTEIRKMNTRQLYPSPADREELLKKLEKNKVLINLEVDLVKKNGQVLHCLENVVGNFNEQGKLTRFQGYIMDISPRKAMEEKLKEQALYNQQILQTTRDGFILADAEGQLIDVNESYCNMVGYSLEELLTMNIRDLEVKIPSKEVERRIEQMISNEKDQFETQHKRRDGSIVDLEVSISITKRKDKPLVAAFVRDITQRKKAAKILKDSEYLLRESQIVSQLGSYDMDIYNGTWESSEILMGIFGIDNDYHTTVEGWIKIVHTDDREMMLNYFTHNVLSNFEPFDKEYRIKRINDQKERWVHGLGKLEFDQEGKPVKMIGTIQDITERKLTAVALQESETMYRSLIENSNDAIYLLHNRRFEVVNDRFTQMFGYSHEEITHPHFDFRQLAASNFKQLVEKSHKSLMSGKIAVLKYEFTAITKNGEEFDVEVSASSIQYKEGKATQGIIRDITERKKRQEILMNAVLKVQENEKYKFGKELHDGLGQVLTSASLYLESLRKIKGILPKNKYNDLEKARQLNKQAITDTRRISHGLMITGMDEHGLIHLIKQICYDASMPELKFKFSHKNIDERLITNETKVHLYRVVQELSTNILNHSGATEANIDLSMDNNGQLKLEVIDNGRGFDLEKTKRGAGLNNINQRITIIKGESEITTSLGKGAKFTFTVPLNLRPLMKN